MKAEDPKRRLGGGVTCSGVAWHLKGVVGAEVPCVHAGSGGPAGEEPAKQLVDVGAGGVAVVVPVQVG